MQRLPIGEKRILEVLLTAYPEAVTNEHVEEVTGYKATSRKTYMGKLAARRLTVAPARGEVRASEILFS